MSVDTFFVISGCLVSYLTLKQLEKAKGRMNVALIYLHRYLRYADLPGLAKTLRDSVLDGGLVDAFRLTGPYGFLVLLHMSLVRYLDVLPRSGVGRLVDGCKEFGWKNFLYIGIYDTDGQEGPSDQLKVNSRGHDRHRGGTAGLPRFGLIPVPGASVVSGLRHANVPGHPPDPVPPVEVRKGRDPPDR